MEVSGELHASATLTQENSPPFPLYGRLDGPQNQSGHFGEEKILLLLSLIKLQLRGHPVCSQVTILTELQILIKWGVEGCGLDLSGSEQGPLMDFSEDCSEPRVP
jgi:hypothetical protein